MDTPAGLASGCGVCKALRPLTFCAGCTVIQYCCVDHQRSDWPAHKPKCKLAQTTHQNLHAEEGKLRTGGMDPFECSVGQFTTILERTKPYLLARLDYVRALAQISTRPSLEEALVHAKEIIHLDRADSIKVREIIPFLLIRLDKDQEAYDFIKWWCLNGFNPFHRWSIPATPYINLDNEDVYEDVEGICAHASDKFPFLAAMMILKIKLLVELKTLRKALKSMSPAEKVEQVQTYEPRSEVFLRNPKKIQEAKWNKDIEELEDQVLEMLVTGKKVDISFWAALLTAGDSTKGHITLENYKAKTPRIQMIIHHTFAAFNEVPGSFQVLRSRM